MRGNDRSPMLTLVIGVTLSTVLGVFFYFKTDLTTAVATFAGLVGTTITLQIESLLQERQSRESASRQQEFMRQIESTPWMPDLLNQAVDSYASIARTYGGTATVLGLAYKAFEDCRTQLSELQRGRYITPDPDESPNSPTHVLTDRLQHTLLATSSGDDISWWLDSSLSRVYWQRNIEAMKRGVTIKRIFIYRDWTAEIESLVEAQHAAGVHIFRVAENRLPAALCLNIVLWDDVCALEPRHNSAGEWIASSFTFAAHELSLLHSRFALIESFAEKWPVSQA